VGKSPSDRREMLIGMGWLSMIVGAGLAGMGWQESTAVGRPYYGYSLGADAALILGSGLLIRGVLVR
jgi:hypothetical protein